MPSIADPALPEQLAPRLRRHVEHLAGEIGERNPGRFENLERARGYIQEQFAESGYTTGHDSFAFEDWSFRNVFVEKKGATRETFVVGAHYDTVRGSPGADDNASGVACLLELARLLRDGRSPHTLRFVAFTLEEHPYFRTPLMGSRVHARLCRRHRDPIVGMAALEMVGYYSDDRATQRFPLPLMSLFYPRTGNFVAVAGNYGSRKLVRRIRDLLDQESDLPVESVALPVPAVQASDNWSFVQAGYPACMITDTSFYRNPHYHLASDRPETLDYRKMGQLVSGLARALVRLAPRP